MISGKVNPWGGRAQPRGQTHSLTTFAVPADSTESFVLPRGPTADRTPVSAFIWLDGDIPRLTSISKQTSGCLGLVKGFASKSLVSSGPGRFGSGFQLFDQGSS